VKKTTTITVAGERWDVPRGFGAEYRRRALMHAHGDVQHEASVLSDLLLLVGYEASAETIAAWPLRKRVEAEVYAANVHARAGDNPVQRHPALSWLPEPWQGPPADVSHIRESLRGAFAGPTGTRLS
jgi:hypothetical protein